MEAQRFLFGRPAVRMDPFNSGNLLGVKLPQQRRFLFFFFSPMLEVAVFARGSGRSRWKEVFLRVQGWEESGAAGASA